MVIDPQIIVVTNRGEIEIPWQADLTLRDLMLDADIPLSSGCNGSGQCGRCKILVIRGNASQVCRYEKETLSHEEIRSGIRLACQYIPLGRISVKPLSQALFPDWTLIDIENKTVFAQAPRPFWPRQNRYALAVDLGTTRIRISLWDMEKGKRLVACAGNNPQACYGFDVLTRITRAVESKNQARKISRMARDAIKNGMDLLEDHHLEPETVGRVLISGNTAMLTLLAEKNYDHLLKPDFWMKKIPCQPENTEAWRREWKFSHKARIDLIEPLAGFVGSDLIAAVLATGLKKESSCALLVDFGTNSEIALWDTKQLWVTAAAGGPAFELGTSECGMPAVEGAVYRFEQDSPDQIPRYDVMGDGEPKGICGSAMVDIIACMVRQGRITPNGNFHKDLSGNRLPVLDGLWLHKKDVDAFQRAKAAVAAGIACLLNRAGKEMKDIQRLCICGAFGQFLHLDHAKAIGLLPPVQAYGIELWGEAALMGTEQLLADPGLFSDKANNDITLVNMSLDKAFETHFINNLFLKPINTEEGDA